MVTLVNTMQCVCGVSRLEFDMYQYMRWVGMLVYFPLKVAAEV